MVELGNDGAVKMSHMEVLQPAHKCSWQTVAKSDKEPAWPKTCIPAVGMITHKEPCMQCTLKGVSCTGMLGKTCNACMRIKQGCEKSSKAAGKKAQAGTSVVQSMKAPKASPSKWGHNNDNDDDIVEVVKSRAHGKGKGLVHGGLDDKTTTALSQALMMVRAEAMASHAATMHLQVSVDQLTEAP
ncbi:hypothetical protein F5J12DRAFT_897063 [Pisolithus orientalis]|uniref:uncharacterized protein n=1 Tax=Pisolithus orientalis TaxID=936130 RepID=UPI002224D926|nr:uncharacterized protein F5J12DRAFT_897063 [Pisolithus orientalis]KAI5993138.1 hypothetical protein F5J12DRAFT_897063 [Pisolithus orientalis]